MEHEKHISSMKTEMQKMCDMMMEMHEKMETMMASMPGESKIKDKMSKMKAGEEY